MKYYLIDLNYEENISLEPEIIELNTKEDVIDLLKRLHDLDFVTVIKGEELNVEELLKNNNPGTNK